MTDDGVTKTPEPASDEPAAAKPGRSRGIIAVTLIVVASLLLPLAGLTVWVRNMMLNTDRYVETVSPVASDPAVQEAIATRVSIALVDELNVEQRAKSALPERAQFLAAPITTGATQLVHNATLRLVGTDQFQTLWEAANRRAHDQIVAALTGRDSKHVVNDKGKVVLQLGPMAAKVAQQLSKIGFGLPSSVDVNRLNVRFVLIDSADLKSVQDYTNILNKLAWVLPILALLLYAAAIVIAPRKRVALVRVGIGIVVAMVVMVIAYGFARTAYLDSLPGPGKHEAGAVIFDTLTRYLQRGVRVLLVVGVLVWLIAWLAGPSRPAQAVRRQWNGITGKDGDGRSGEPGPVNRWVADHIGLLRGLLLGALALVLVISGRPTGKLVLLLLLIGLVGLGVIQLLAGGGRRREVPAET
jgi:hypothetical protein